MSKCPFGVGDVVRFTPSERTQGLYQNIGRFGLEVGEEVEVRAIKGDYLCATNGTDSWPWSEFTLVRKAVADQ